MKTLMIGLTPPLEGGSQQHIYELSKRIDCDVLTQEGSICNNKITVKPSGHILFALAVYLWCIHLLFCKKKYDIIHIHENTLYFLSILLSLRYKIIITVHGLKGFKFYDNKMLWFFFKGALNCADSLIAVSPSDSVLLNCEVSTENKFISNGVDLSLYANNEKDIVTAITFIGRIHPQKGIDILLKAFSEINQEEKKHYSLTLIGDDKSNYAKKLYEKYKIETDISWIGKIDDRKDIADILSSSYMIVLPSRWEGLPLTLFESLASGRPVIVSDIPAFKSVVTDKEVLFFSSENSDDLKEKIFKLLEDNNMADELGKKGKEFAKDYDWEIISKRTKELYNK